MIAEYREGFEDLKSASSDATVTLHLRNLTDQNTRTVSLERDELMQGLTSRPRYGVKALSRRRATVLTWWIETESYSYVTVEIPQAECWPLLTTTGTPLLTAQTKTIPTTSASGTANPDGLGGEW